MHKPQIQLNKLAYKSGEMENLKPLEHLGQEILSTAKFWILYLTLASCSSKTGKIILPRGLSDLAIYGVEDSCDNRILLADFLPDDIDKDEILADSFLLDKWQEHMRDVESNDDYESVQENANGKLLDISALD